jgi:hypothetical protein
VVVESPERLARNREVYETILNDLRTAGARVIIKDDRPDFWL